MNCYLSAIAGFALIGGSVSTLTISEDQHNMLRTVFSNDLDQKYENIINERRNHYIIGLILGLIIAIFVTNQNRSINYFTRITLFFAITLATAVIFYTVMPKSDYMLKHLKTPEENKKWLEVYQFMRMRYMMGLALGALAAIPIANIFC